MLYEAPTGFKSTLFQSTFSAAGIVHAFLNSMPRSSHSRAAVLLSYLWCWRYLAFSPRTYHAINMLLEVILKDDINLPVKPLFWKHWSNGRPETTRHLLKVPLLVDSLPKTPHIIVNHILPLKSTKLFTWIPESLKESSATEMVKTKEDKCYPWQFLTQLSWIDQIT